MAFPCQNLLMRYLIPNNDIYHVVGLLQHVCSSLRNKTRTARPHFIHINPQ